MIPKIKHILYAEDDAEDLELFEEAIIKVSDMTVTTAKDGKGLIESLKVLPVPDFILLDLFMPFYDGRSCIKAIRNLSRFDNVPVMVYSTIDVEDLASQCKNLGADYFIAKPANFVEILRLVFDISSGEYQRINHSLNEGLLYKCA
jgi:CheY-like chemotaxis protein